MTKQLYLADNMAPPHNLDIEQALDLWLEAKDEQKRAADTTKLRHATLLLHMASVGCDAYPFIDRATGKKKQVVIARDPKAKTTRAPRRNRKDDDVEIGEAVVVDDDTPDKSDGKVESRRISRAAAEKELGSFDPFAGTRAAMAEDQAAEEQAEAAHVGDVALNGPKAKRKAKKSK